VFYGELSWPRKVLKSGHRAVTEAALLGGECRCMVMRYIIIQTCGRGEAHYVKVTPNRDQDSVESGSSIWKIFRRFYKSKI
jgi:hypothetical protein